MCDRAIAISHTFYKICESRHLYGGGTRGSLPDRRRCCTESSLAGVQGQGCMGAFGGSYSTAMPRLCHTPRTAAEKTCASNGLEGTAFTPKGQADQITCGLHLSICRTLIFTSVHSICCTWVKRKSSYSKKIGKLGCFLLKYKAVHSLILIPSLKHCGMGTKTGIPLLCRQVLTDVSLGTL